MTGSDSGSRWVTAEQRLSRLFSLSCSVVAQNSSCPACATSLNQKVQVQGKFSEGVHDLPVYMAQAFE
jgi:hypothetical protein